jgi:hypothetical protein
MYKQVPRLFFVSNFYEKCISNKLSVLPVAQIYKAVEAWNCEVNLWLLLF